MGRSTLAAMLWIIPACGGGGLKLKLIDSSHQKPSNVAVYFRVNTDDGEPVPGLTADAFEISEDGGVVSVHESKQTILNPEVAAAHYAILLVDMSGSVTESDDVPTIISASTAFTDRIGKYQKVAVYAFDGRSELYQLSDFTGDSRRLASGLASLDNFEPKDPSTNLNGAVIEALDRLDKQMRRAREPLVFGTLIVFTDGRDRAARVARKDLSETLDQTTHDIYVIGVGEEIDEDELNEIGRSGAILTKNRQEITSAFEQTAARVEAASRSYYLLGYCSPARNGVHKVTITASTKEHTGSLSYEFDARGFSAPCDSNKPPRFDIKRPREPAPEGEEDGGSRW